MQSRRAACLEIEGDCSNRSDGDRPLNINLSAIGQTYHHLIARFFSQEMQRNRHLLGNRHPDWLDHAVMTLAVILLAPAVVDDHLERFFVLGVGRRGGGGRLR